MTSQISTRAVHAGEERRKPYGALTTPIVQTSTYTFEDTAEIMGFMRQKELAGGMTSRTDYGRYGNPTQTAVEGKVASLEGAEGALLFSSGMNAITTALGALLSKGDHLVLVQEAYHRTREFAEIYLSRWGIETTFASIDDPDALPEAIRPTTRVVFAETPSNPYLGVMDLSALARLAEKHGLTTIIDSTFATPLNLCPLAYGIDLVIHSATKYLAGHNDLLAGMVAGPAHLLSRVREARDILGGVASPHDAYLLLRGLKTLDLRIRRQNDSAMRLATFLDGHPAVQQVFYPGLRSHPQHDLAVAQMAGFGGVVSFELRGDLETTSRFIDLLRIPYIGPTLGGVESVVQQPVMLFSLDPAERESAGLKENLVRYAVGIEDPDDLIEDLDQALQGSQRSGGTP
jgi:cystathionine gamma-synthase